MTKNKYAKFRLKLDGDSGDGKREFVVGNDENFRMEVDTDDCDSAEAKRVMRYIIKCVNNPK